MLSRVQLSVTLWTVAHQAPLSMGILQARILGWAAISFSRAQVIQLKSLLVLTPCSINLVNPGIIWPLFSLPTRRGCNLNYFKRQYTLFFLNGFRFIVKVSGKSECSLTWTTSCTSGILHYSRPFAPISEPTLTRPYYPKSIVYFRVHSWPCTFHGFSQLHGYLYPSL